MKPISYFILILFLISACRETAPEKKSDYGYGGEGNEENIRARKKWDIERMADPATGRIPAMMRMKELAYAATLPSDGMMNARSGFSGVNWDFRGPWNLGGRTRAFAIDVSNENILLAGGVSGGMWRSTDAGLTWTRTTPINEYPGVNALVQDKRPGHTNTWYYLSGEAYGTSASGGSAFYLGNGMYKSSDGGITWSSLASTVSGTPQTFDNVWDVTWNVTTDNGNTTQDVVYTACYDAIYRSVNGGNAWTLVKGNAGSTGASSYFTDVAVTGNSVVYATLSSDGIHKGIWRAAGSTGTFINILPGNFPATYDRLVIGIDPNNENIVYFFGPTPGYGKISTDWQGDTLYNSLWKYEYVSGNGSGAGGIWTDLSQNMPGNINTFNGLNTQGGYDAVVAVKPGNSNVIFIGGTNIYRSNSGFTDSLNTEIAGGYAIGAALPFVDEYPGHHPDQHVFAFLPSNPDIMYVACDGGISKCMDNTATPVVWNELNDGFITSQFYTVAIDHGSTNDIVIGGLQDNGTWFTNNTNSTSPWTHSFDGDGSYCAIENGGAHYYMSKQQGRLLKATLNSNGNITSYRRFDPIGAQDYQFINPFVLDPNNNNIMYLAGGRFLWRNDDLSGIALTNTYDSITTNWTKFTDSLVAGESITAVAVSKSPANRVYYGTNKRKIFRIDNADSGTPSSTEITNTTIPVAAYVSCIAVNPQNADEIVVVYSNYSTYSVVQSLDGGTSWNRVAGNLEQNSSPSGSGNGPSCRWATILPVADGTVYLIGASTGLYATDTLIHNGTVWVQQGLNTIGHAVVDMMTARESDGLIVVGTHGNGLYSTHITSVSDIVSIEEVNANSLALEIYPNPVRNQLTFSVKNFKGTGKFNAEILMPNGQVARKFVFQPDAAGKVEMDISGFADGMYYIRIYKGKEKISKSFVKIH